MKELYGAWQSWLNVPPHSLRLTTEPSECGKLADVIVYFMVSNRRSGVALPCVTDTVVYPPTGSTAYEREMSNHQHGLYPTILNGLTFIGGLNCVWVLEPSPQAQAWLRSWHWVTDERMLKCVIRCNSVVLTWERDRSSDKTECVVEWEYIEHEV